MDCRYPPPQAPSGIHMAGVWNSGCVGGSHEDHLRGMLVSIDGSPEKDADNVTVLLRRGLTLHKMGQYGGDDACLDRAVDLAGDDERDLAREVMCMGKGVAMNRLRRYDEAVSYYKKAIKINPTRGETYFFMDCAMDDKAESAKSVKYFDRATRLGHTAPDVYYGKARAEQLLAAPRCRALPEKGASRSPRLCRCPLRDGHILHAPAGRQARHKLLQEGDRG